VSHLDLSCGDYERPYVNSPLVDASSPFLGNSQVGIGESRDADVAERTRWVSEFTGAQETLSMPSASLASPPRAMLHDQSKETARRDSFGDARARVIRCA
jgi:hypothetical protein